MKPLLIKAQLIDETGARITRLVVVPVKRTAAAAGSFDVNLSLAYTDAARALVLPPSDHNLPAGRFVATSWGSAITPHLAQWIPELAQDTWETIMSCATFTPCSPDVEGLGRGLFLAHMFAGLLPQGEGLDGLKPLEIGEWAAPQGRLAWLVALGQHLADPAADELLLLAARRVLQSEKLPQKPRAELLEQAARRCADRAACILRGWCRTAPSSCPTNAAAAADAFVKRLIEHMRALGQRGALLADATEQGGGEAAELMLRRADETSFDAPLLLWLIDALWHDEIGPRMTTHRPALARALVHDGLLPLFARGVDVRGEQIIARDNGVVVAELAPSVDAALAERLAQPGALEIFGRVYAHRLITYLARTVHEQMEARAGDFRAVTFEGGFSGLREAIGYNDSKNDELKELLWAGQGIQFAHNTIQGGGLWTWSNTRGPRGRLQIVAGAPLLPNFIEVYDGKSFDMRQARRLIPVLEHEPRLDMLNPRSQGAALTLVWLMLVELRDNAEQLAANGAIRTTAARWRELAERAGLPAGQVGGILDAWGTAGGDAVQLIERDGAEWTLAEPHALARDFIVEAGRDMERGGRNGRQGKRAKRAQAR